MSFVLAPQLDKDCHRIGRRNDIHILLHRNALFPWFILVPESNETEFYRLGTEQQQRLIDLINDMSAFISQNHTIDKLNVATIGNIVSQLHVHVVGRSRNDPCWPGVVWGTSHFTPYPDNAVDTIQQQLLTAQICSAI